MKSNWQTKKLGEICDFQNGFAFKSSEYVDSGFFVMRIGNVQDGYISLSDPKFIKNSYKPFNKFVLQSGDILISLTGNVGRVGVINNNHLPAVINQRVARVSLKSDSIIIKQFLLYFIKSSYFIKELVKAGHGAAQQNISTKDVENLEINFPPLSEQLRIVKILDEVFAKTAQVKENAEKNLQNAKDLFESYLQNVFDGSKDNLQKLDNVCKISSKLIDPRKKEFLELIHVGAGNIEVKTSKLIDLKTAEEEKLISGKFLFDESMVLYSKIRPYLMKVVRPDFNGLCSADIYPLVPNNKLLIRDYLFYLLLSPVFTEFAIKGSARAGMPKVNREHLFSFEFSLPSLAEQKSIVAKLDALSEQTKKLEVIYKQKIADLEELKKSFLQKAFKGEL